MIPPVRMPQSNKSKKHLALTITALSTFCSVNAYSQQTDQERIKDLEQRLLELEQQVQKQSKKSATRVQEVKNKSDRKFLAIPKTTQRPSHDFEAPDKSIVLSNSDTTLQLGGQIWLDAIYNQGEMTNRASFQTSSIAYEENTTKDNTLLSAGQSKLSFKSYTPTLYGAMTTRFEFDMFDDQGIGRYINDTCCSFYRDETGGVDAGLDANGRLTAIPVTGGFAYYNKQWSKKWSSAIGYSYLAVDNLVTQKGKAIKNSAYSTVNLIWYPDSQVKAGVEFQYGDIQSKSGLEGDNFRIQNSVGFKY